VSAAERWNQNLIRRLAVYNLPPGDDCNSGPVYELRSGGWKGEHRECAVLDNS